MKISIVRRIGLALAAIAVSTSVVLSAPAAQAATGPSAGTIGQEDVTALEMYTDMAAIKVETKKAGNQTFYAFKIKNVSGFTAKNVTVWKRTTWDYVGSTDFHSEKLISFHWDSIPPGQEIPVTIMCEPKSGNTYCAAGSIYVETTFAEKNHDNNYAEYKSSYP